MIIVGKSIIDKEQLVSKKKYGVKDIEIQLYGKDFLRTTEDMYEEIVSTDVNIVAIHLPLNVEGFEDLNLEFFSHKDCSEIFIQVCRLAQELADYYCHDINIIVHNGLSLKKYLLMPKLLDSIVELFDYVLEIFPNITFSFENLVPFIFKEKKIVAFDGSLFDNVDLANYFNNTCLRPAFFTTLDICHILYTFKILGIFEEDCVPKYSIRDFIEQNKNTLNNIHFCNLKNWGLKGIEHGYYFDKDNIKDINFVKEVLNILKEYHLEVPLTLEVRETDYIICDSFRRTLEVIQYVEQINE